MPPHIRKAYTAAEAVARGKHKACRLWQADPKLLPALIRAGCPDVDACLAALCFSLDYKRLDGTKGAEYAEAWLAAYSYTRSQLTLSGRKVWSPYTFTQTDHMTDAELLAELEA